MGVKKDKFIMLTTTPADVLKMAAEAEMVDIRFIDLPGTWQHFTMPVQELTEEIFEEGIGFDGSSIRGFQEIDESDMLLIPDPTTAFIDPVFEDPTLVIICDVHDTITLERYSRDPRHVAQKAEEFLKQTGIANISDFGPELEFFMFNDVRYGEGANTAFYQVDSVEGWWQSGEELNPNLGRQIPTKGGYFPVPPADRMQDVRTKIIKTSAEVGIRVEKHHHEVATAGQSEIDIHFDSLTRMADKVMLYKYIVKNVARQNGLTATFMPKPIFGDNGNGMHVHQSLWQDEKSIMYAAGTYANLSDAARYYIGGLLKHAPAVLALAAPSTNSYKRLVPGFEAPTTLVYSQRNRSAICRIPTFSKHPEATHIEFRAPDPSSNPYLCFAALLMAGLDGIQNQIDPGDPLDKNIFHLSPEEAAELGHTPHTLAEALDALEADHEFLMQGGVFTQDLLDTYITYERENEVDPLSLRPHPFEFIQYFDV
jgi:glutamine synthetase